MTDEPDEIELFLRYAIEHVFDRTKLLVQRTLNVSARRALEKYITMKRELKTLKEEIEQLRAKDREQ